METGFWKRFMVSLWNAFCNLLNVFYPRVPDEPNIPVDIPPSFLLSPPSTPITCTAIDFATTPLPQHAGKVAFVLDNVLSESECAQLIALAERSVTPADGSPWRKALVTVRAGWKMPVPLWRDGTTILWKCQDVADRIMERCWCFPGLKERLREVVTGTGEGTGEDEPKERWEFRRLNERLGFLRYGPGQFFKAHVDGACLYKEDGKDWQSYYTLQIYLNDSTAHNPDAELVGGATSFVTRMGSGRVDVHPKAGSVLIFQHSGLRHEGARVERGVKYTLRTSIFYECVGTISHPNSDDEDGEGEGSEERKEMKEVVEKL